MGKFLGMSIIFFSQKMSWASEPMAIGLGGFIDLPFGAKSSSNSLTTTAAAIRAKAHGKCIDETNLQSEKRRLLAAFACCVHW